MSQQIPLNPGRGNTLDFVFWSGENVLPLQKGRAPVGIKHQQPRHVTEWGKKSS